MGNRRKETGERRKEKRCGLPRPSSVFSVLTLCSFLLSPASFLLSPASFLPTAAAQDLKLPDEKSFFAAIRENMARANREQHRYAYKERRTELHTNPFGRLGTDGVVVYDVTPGPAPNITFRRLLEKDGKPVTNSRPEKQERRVRTSGRSIVDDTVNVLDFTIDRRETITGRSAIVVRFEPKPDADAETREGKMAQAFKGFIWVDEAAREVMRAEATAIDDLSYGFGLLARIRKGSTVTLTRERIDDIWLPTSVKFKGDGRALFALRKLHIDFSVEWFDYRRM
jgi:hypothetical protein